MRKLGLDYGDKTVGVALSDESLLLAQPIITLTRNNPIDIKSTVDELVKIIDENEVDEVVIGLPVNMDGSEGERVDKTKWFAKKLSKKTSVPINFWDERLSTISASKILDEGNVKRSEQKKYVDKIAASIILQSFLDALKNK